MFTRHFWVHSRIQVSISCIFKAYFSDFMFDVWISRGSSLFWFELFAEVKKEENKIKKQSKELQLLNKHVVSMKS